MVALQQIFFPTDEPVMPEARQIGRKPSIQALQEALEAARHQWLIGERRIGKTSVAKAVLARLRSRGAVALDVDLSSVRIKTAADLAGELAGQAQAAGVGSPGRSRRQIASFARRGGRQAKALAAVLETLGFADEGEALMAVAGLLAGADDGKPGLDRVPQALAIHAQATQEHVSLLLDEVHLLAGLEQGEAAVAEACKKEGHPIAFVLAGSEESAARELREPGQPLEAVAHEFSLAPIAREDWLPGLRSRFAEARIEIADRELNAIVTASDCHPRRTMQIAANVEAMVRPLPHDGAGPELVALAISDAKDDRAWS